MPVQVYLYQHINFCGDIDGHKLTQTGTKWHRYMTFYEFSIVEKCNAEKNGSP